MMDLDGLLSEHAACGDDKAERATFFATLANSQDMQAVIFSAVQPDAADPTKAATGDRLTKLLSLLLQWYRHLSSSKETSCRRHLVLQFLPSALALSLCLRRGGCGGHDQGQGGGADGRRRAKELETFLMAVHSHRSTEEGALPVADQVFWVQQSLSHSSVYHDGSRHAMESAPSSSSLHAGGGRQQHQQGDGELVHLPQFKTTQPSPIRPNVHLSTGTQGRLMVVESLYRLYNSALGDYSKTALEQFVKVTQALLERGYRHSQKRTPTHHKANSAAVLPNSRVHLPGNVLLEILHGAYFCIYNGFQVRGSHILELVRLRGSALSSPQVLVSVNAVRTLVLTSGPSHLPATSISTPSQIAKNMITNASFRAKKISEDIAKVQEHQKDGAVANDALANNLKVLANMTAISEEVVEDVVLDKVIAAGGTPPSSAGKSKEGGGGKISKDKIKAKLHNLPSGFKKRLMENEKDHHHHHHHEKKADKKREKEKGGSDDGGSGSAAETKPLLSQQQEVKAKGEKKKGEKTLSSGKASSSATASVSTLSGAAASGGAGTEDGGGFLQNGNGLSSQQQQPDSSSPASSSNPSAQPPSTPVPHNPKATPPTSLLQATAVISASQIESMEQVEKLIQMKRLPAETVTIHSPESGTTIF